MYKLYIIIDVKILPKQVEYTYNIIALRYILKVKSISKNENAEVKLDFLDG